MNTKHKLKIAEITVKKIDVKMCKKLLSSSEICLLCYTNRLM